VLEPVTEPEKFGELSQTKMKIGIGAFVCMANDLLPIDAKNWYVPVWMIKLFLIPIDFIKNS